MPPTDRWKFQNNQWEVLFDAEEQSLHGEEIQLQLENICTSEF